MPTELDWQIEGYVLYLREYGIIQDADLQSINQELFQLLDRLDPDEMPVHLILDQRGIEQRTPNISMLKDCLTLYAHPALGWTVIVSDDTPLWHFLKTTAKQYTSAQLERVASLENALCFLGKVDRRLAWLVNEVEG